MRFSWIPSPSARLASHGSSTTFILESRCGARSTDLVGDPSHQRAVGDLTTCCRRQTDQGCIRHLGAIRPGAMGLGAMGLALRREVRARWRPLQRMCMCGGRRLRRMMGRTRPPPPPRRRRRVVVMAAATVTAVMLVRHVVLHTSRGRSSMRSAPAVRALPLTRGASRPL